MAVDQVVELGPARREQRAGAAAHQPDPPVDEALAPVAVGARDRSGQDRRHRRARPPGSGWRPSTRIDGVVITAPPMPNMPARTPEPNPSTSVAAVAQVTTSLTAAR